MKVFKLWPGYFKIVLFVGLIWLTGWWLPVTAQAAVMINEIAWMGTSVSANDEWIELYNTGEATVVDGWTLTDGLNLTISLSGTVGGGEYVVLERTDDNTVPGNAFAIYTGALANTGGTLTLRRGDNSIEDQVAGGENWSEIGGNNETKETAQYFPQGWQSGISTPGAANLASPNPPNSEENEDDVENNNGENSSVGEVESEADQNNKAISLQLPDTELSLKVEIPTTVYVNQSFKLEAIPWGLGKTIMNSLTYTWNFGDLSVKSGKEVVHSYSYPGDYVISLQAEYGRYDQVARTKVTVLPVKFSLARSAKGDLLVHNNAKYEVDLSGYSIVGSETIFLPKNTFILPNATLTISKNKVSKIAVLKDNLGTVVAIEGVGDLSGSAKPVTVALDNSTNFAPIAKDIPITEQLPANFNFVGTAAAASNEQTAEVFNVPEQANLAAVVGEAKVVTNNWTYLGLLGLILTVGGLLYSERRSRKLQENS